MDIFLDKYHGHGPKNPIDLNQLCPGIKGKFVGDPKFIAKLEFLLRNAPCDGKTHKFKKRITVEYLPFIDVLNGPFPGDPLTDLPEHKMIGGTVRFDVEGTVDTNVFYRKRAGCRGNIRCCTRSGEFEYKAKDPFSFGYQIGREWPLYGANTFAKHYTACRILQSECGHKPPPWWTISGTFSHSFTKCGHQIGIPR
jgi:hypothetical protein